MILTVDSSTLALLINPDARPPLDPKTGQLLSHAKARIEGLIDSLSASDAIIIPTPVLAEVLVAAEDSGPDILQSIQSLAHVRTESFDQRAAVETALMTKEALAGGRKRGDSSQPWQKVKFDRQIIAIARVTKSDAIFSDDTGLISFATAVGTDVTSTWDLPVPPGSDDLFSVLHATVPTEMGDED